MAPQAIELRGAQILLPPEAAPRLPPAARLLALHLAPAPGERVLLLGAGHPAAGVALARLLPQGHLTIFEPELPAAQAARGALQLNQIASAAVSEAISQLPAGAGQYDRVAIVAPQSRELSRRWIVEARALLGPAGALSLAGANEHGVRSAVADAQACLGPAQPIALGGGARLVELRRAAAPHPPPPWAAGPGVAPGTWRIVRAELPAGPTELRSLPGVFSAERLDPGTALLLAHLPPCAGLRVLDLGCGYGPIGVAAAQAGAAWVDLVDTSLLAVAAAGANLAALGLPGEALAGAATTPVAGRSYDLILSNPPFHSGRQIDTSAAAAFIAGGRRLLRPGGRLILVANSFLPYDRLIAAHFGQVTTLADNRRYRVLLGAA